jgi:hypothetical protein
LFSLGTALSILSIAGCGSQAKHIAEISKPSYQEKTAQWPELTALMRPEDPADPSLEKVLKARGNNAKVIIGSPKFQEAIKKFEETPIPDDKKTPEREASKQKLVTGLKELSKLVQSAPPKDVMKKASEVTTLYAECLKIPGQEAPTGAAAAKFAQPPVASEEDKAKHGPRRE